MQPKLSDVTSRVILPVPALLESNTSSDAINGRRPQLVERPAAGFQAGIRRMERAARGSNSRVVEILQDSSHEFPPACKVGQAWIRKPSDAELTQTSGTSPNCAAAPQAAFASFDLTGDTDQIPDCSPNRLPFPQETCAKAKRLPFHQEAPARVQDSQVARSSEDMKPVDEGGDADEVLTAHPEEELNDVLEWENRVRQDFAKEAKELAKKVYAMVSAQGKLPLAQRLPIAPPFAIAKLLFTLPLFRGSAPFHRAWGWCVKAASGAMLRHGRRYQRLYTQGAAGNGCIYVVIQGGVSLEGGTAIHLGEPSTVSAGGYCGVECLVSKCAQRQHTCIWQATGGAALSISRELLADLIAEPTENAELLHVRNLNIMKPFEYN